jgi:hypothetical protein
MSKEGGREVAYVGYRFPTEAIFIILPSYFDVVFYSMYFHFRQVKQNTKATYP